MRRVRCESKVRTGMDGAKTEKRGPEIRRERGGCRMGGKTRVDGWMNE